MKNYKVKFFYQLSTQSGKRKKTNCQILFNRFKKQNVFISMCNHALLNVNGKKLSEHSIKILHLINHF